jgi:hypothetical protein
MRNDGRNVMCKHRTGAAMNLIIFTVMQLLPFTVVKAEELKPLSITMESYDYPYRVEFMPLTIEGQDLRMAYMNVPPEGKDRGRAVLLLHGKNFFGAYWSVVLHHTLSSRLILIMLTSFPYLSPFAV